MKKYILLGHIFELEPRAYEFLKHYIDRIDLYADEKNIDKDILEDIKYNVIEKLYQSQAPITEAYVMNLAETIGEPEDIFEEEKTIKKEKPKNFFEKRLGKERPMVWGVAYWISTSLKIPVSIVRLVFIIMVLIYGTGIWLYPLLALFVPFQDKKTTTGQTGNLFFEIIRVLIWLGVIFFLGSILFGSLLGITVFSMIPPLGNQSLQTLVPSFIYPFIVVSIVSLVILIIGAIGALIKKFRVSKTIVIIAITIIIGSFITAGITSLNVINRYNMNQETTDIQLLTTGAISDSNILINLHSDQKTTQGNYFMPLFGREFSNLSNSTTFQKIDLVASKDENISVKVEDTFNILPQSEQKSILSKRSDISTSISGNTIDITIPHNIFTQKVPFSFAQRTIIIAVPTNKKIIYNNDSNVRYSTPSSWIETRDKKDYEIYCTDKFSFLYHTSSNSWRCADTTSSQINTYNQDDRNWDIRLPSDDDEEFFERIFIGLGLEEAQNIAARNAWTLRIVEQNEVDIPYTPDYQPGRLNIEVENNIITDVEVE